MTKKEIFERNRLLLIDRMEYVLSEIKEGNLVDADMFFEQKREDDFCRSYCFKLKIKQDRTKYYKNI